MQKLYFSISEISELLGETSNILRYWEKEFPILKPKKNRKGNRTYSPKDLIILKSIKKLLRDDMLSIKDAKAKLPEEIKRMESETEATDKLEEITDAELTEESEKYADIELADEIEAIDIMDIPAEEDTEFNKNETTEESDEYESSEVLSIGEDEDEPEEMFDITDSIKDIYSNYIEKDELLSFLDELLKKVKNL